MWLIVPVQRMLLSSPIVHYSLSFGLLWIQLGNAARALVDHWDDHIP